MELRRLRSRMPLVAFILLAIVCLALFGFACACLTDHPMQALERALSALVTLPPIAVAYVTVAGGLAAAAFERRRWTPAPSAAALQRFRL